MRKLSFLTFATLTLCTACGKDEPTATTSAVAAPEANLHDGNLRWTASAKSCGTRTLELEPHERYHFNKDHFIKISEPRPGRDDHDGRPGQDGQREHREHRDRRQHCEATTIYDRVVASSSRDSGGYVEDSTLRATAVKTTCWERRRDGSLGQFRETIRETRDRMRMRLQLTGQNLKVELRGADECRGQPLHLELKPN